MEKFAEERIDKAIRNLIVCASKYPDEDLADAIDAVRLIIRQQQNCIEYIKGVYENKHR